MLPVMLRLVSSITTTLIGLNLVVEEHDGLELVVVVDLEFLLGKIGHEASLGIEDRDEERDDAGARLEGRLLREETTAMGRSGSAQTTAKARA